MREFTLRDEGQGCKFIALRCRDVKRKIFRVGFRLFLKGRFRKGRFRGAVYFNRLPGFQPLVKFSCVGVNGGTPATRYSMGRESTIRVPALDGSFHLAKVGRNLLPAIQSRTQAGFFPI